VYSAYLILTVQPTFQSAIRPKILVINAHILNNVSNLAKTFRDATFRQVYAFNA
jgi:hypothetical protein